MTPGLGHLALPGLVVVRLRAGGGIRTRDLVAGAHDKVVRAAGHQLVVFLADFEHTRAVERSPGSSQEL